MCFFPFFLFPQLYRVSWDRLFIQWEAFIHQVIVFLLAFVRESISLLFLVRPCLACHQIKSDFS